MTSAQQTVFVSGAFDNIRSRHLRLLQEAARLGPVTVLLWPDEAIASATGTPPKFPLSERLYFLNAVRYVSQVVPATGPIDPDALPDTACARPGVWADEQSASNDGRRKFCDQHGLEYRIITARQMEGFPEDAVPPASPGRKKVVVTGSYDWLHSGHVRFFEEVSAYGDLYVIVGHDANIHLLKGEGHPLVPENERRYLAGSIRYVKQAMVSSGDGWLDADPEIRRLKPDIYAVNEDGDRGGKREYCRQNGIEYLVLKRTPAPGLPRRSSTDLRGF